MKLGTGFDISCTLELDSIATNFGRDFWPNCWEFIQSEESELPMKFSADSFACWHVLVRCRGAKIRLIRQYLQKLHQVKIVDFPPDTNQI